MKKKIKIYLGDLTYNTVSISTESFPLNVGYIASYCLSKFEQFVDITIFKYIEDLEKAILNEPPDILGLSNYAWNHRIGLEMFRIFLEKNPSGLTVFGGPNFPLDLNSQKNFLNQCKKVDIYVPIEGEVGFSNIINRVLEIGSIEKIKAEILKKPIDGCISRKQNGELQYSHPGIRTKDLDEIPSPYLNGLMDKFFDGKLSPMLQTNRGCPFSCSFCVDGNKEVMSVNRFSFERVTSEIRYIAEHVPKNTHSMFISDLNFGMIPRDLEICDFIGKMQKQFNYPTQIQATTGKNSKERIIDAIKRLNGALRLWMSVQSMDETVLGNIRRSNISKDDIISLAPTIKEAKLRTTSEVILGLPGESYRSHIETLRKLVKAKMDHILVYTCMMLNGAEMNTPTERKKWGLKTKFRILPRDFVSLSNGKKVIEIEEVIVSSNTLSFKEYVELRILAFVIYVTNIGVVYDALLKFLREQSVDVFELFFRTMKNQNEAPQNIRNILIKFKQSTIEELWNSPEEITNNYQNESEYKKLLDGEAGINVLQYYHAMITAEHIDDWTEYTLDIARKLLQEKGSFNDEIKTQFESVANYCRGVSHNTLGVDRMTTNPEYVFDYNIISWLNSFDERKLISFRFEKKSKMTFKLSDKQFKLIQDKLDIFGDTSIGRSQAIKRTPIEQLWRTPVVLA